LLPNKEKLFLQKLSITKKNEEEDSNKEKLQT
jgi:hypothetical protein